MSIRVYFLGTGGAGSHLNRGYPAYLVETGDSLILVDAGMRVESRLRELGFRTCDLTAVVISHRHYDHTAGLLGLLDLQLEEQCSKPLNVYAPSDTVDRLLGVKELLGPRSAPKPMVKPLSYEEASVLSFNSTRVETFPVEHSVPTLGFQIEYGDVKVVYSSDTRPCKIIEEKANNTQLLLHEASFPEKLRQIAEFTKHTTVKEAIEIGGRAELLALIHITHVAEEEARKTTGRRVIVPVDGLVITIS